MLSAEQQAIFFEELLNPLKRHYKTPWCAHYFYFLLQAIEKVLDTHAHFQQVFFRALQAPYQWFQLLSYLDITGGLLSISLALSFCMMIPQLSNIMLIALAGGALSFAVEFICQKIKCLTFFVESKLQDFFGEHIDSDFHADIALLKDFFQTSLLKLPAPVSLLNNATARAQYWHLKTLQAEEIDISPLPAHLHGFNLELQALWVETIEDCLSNFKRQAIKDLTLPSIETQEVFLTRYSHYGDYLSEHERLVVIALVTETPEPCFGMLRDTIASSFHLPSLCREAGANIAWQATLCELMRQECAHFFGNHCCDSGQYRDWLWWLRDKMNGLETTTPSPLSCPYFQEYDVTQWDGLPIHYQPAIILSCSELINACPQNGVSYDK